MPHVEELIERYWTDPAGLDTFEIMELQTHIEECESCAKLMNGYSFAKSLIDEVVSEIDGSEYLADDFDMEASQLDDHADEFIQQWRSSNQYMQLSWKVIMKAMRENGLDIEAMHFPEDCCPEVKWDEEADGADRVGEIDILVRGEIRGVLSIGSGAIGLRSVNGGSSLCLEFHSDGELIETVTGSDTESALEIDDLRGRRLELCFRIAGAGTREKYAV